MKRKTDDLPMTKELGLKLRSLRKKAALTQAELAKLAGGGMDQALVSRLESGLHANPTLAVLADYLRACRAKFSEIADLLDQYTSQPLPVEKEGHEAVAKVTDVCPSRLGKRRRATTSRRRLRAGLMASRRFRRKNG